MKIICTKSFQILEGSDKQKKLFHLCSQRYNQTVVKYRQFKSKKKGFFKSEKH